MDEKQHSKIDSQNKLSEQGSNLDFEETQGADKKKHISQIPISSQEQQEDIEENQLQQDQNTDSNHSDETQGKKETEKSEEVSVSNDGLIEGGVFATIGDSNIQIQNILKVGEFSREESAKDSKEEPFIDPTTELLYKSKNLFEFNLAELEKYAQILEEENLIIISCFDQEILSEFTDELGKSLGDNCQKRFLTFHRENKNNADLTIEFLYPLKI